MPAAKKTAAKKAPAKKSSSSSRGSSASGGRDAIALLKADHKEVDDLFEEYEELAGAEADGAERQALAEQICDMLTVHATIEEEIFYPAARELVVDSDLLDEAEVEHASAKDLIAQIKAMGPDEELYDAKVKVLANTSTTTCRKKKARCSQSAARRRWTSPRSAPSSRLESQN